MSLIRVLLVHANPCQQVLPVPAYGLERLRSAVGGLANVRLVEPYLQLDPLEHLREQISAFKPDLIGIGIRVIEDCIVIDDIEGESDSDVHSFLPEIKLLCQAVQAAAPGVPLVAGGAAFSYFPAEILEHLKIDWGVVGAGERPFRELVSRLAAGRDPEGVAGLIRRGALGAAALREATFGFLDSPTQRDLFYAAVNGMPIRTRIGCAMRCSYCLTASLGRKHVVNSVEAVLDEVETVVAEARRRHLSQLQIFFADDEFNLPDVEHTLAVLRGLQQRGLSKHLSWRAYFNPTPFPDELARLVKETNGHISLTVDTASDRVALVNGKPFRRRHLDAALEQIKAQRLSADLGFIFGLPGETIETMAESIDFIRSLPSQIEVCYSSGARVYPHTPLASLAAADPEHLSGLVGLEPSVYASPLPARELARLLAKAFAGYGHVYPVGVGFARASRAQGTAYQALGLKGEEQRRHWRLALEQARQGGYRQSAGESIDALLDIALWHGHKDLAGDTLRAHLALPKEERAASSLSLRVGLGLKGLRAEQSRIDQARAN